MTEPKDCDHRYATDVVHSRVEIRNREVYLTVACNDCGATVEMAGHLDIMEVVHPEKET